VTAAVYHQDLWGRECIGYALEIVDCVLPGGCFGLEPPETSCEDVNVQTYFPEPASSYWHGEVITSEKFERAPLCYRCKEGMPMHGPKIFAPAAFRYGLANGCIQEQAVDFIQKLDFDEVTT
jgi:hypothetical protein